MTTLVSQKMASVWEKTSATKPLLNIFAIRDLNSPQVLVYDSVGRMKSGVEPCQPVKVSMAVSSITRRSNGVHVVLLVNGFEYKVSIYKRSVKKHRNMNFTSAIIRLLLIGSLHENFEFPIL